MKVLKKYSLIFPNLKLCLIIIIFNEVISQDFQSITPKTLTTGTSLMDVKDYENMNLIITKKEIFIGLDPEKKGEFSEEFPQSSSFATFNSEYLLAACTNKALLSYIKINSLDLEEIFIISYTELGLEKTDNVCSLSYLETYAYIVHVSEGNIMNMIQIKMILNDSGLSCEKDIPFNFTKPKIRSNDNRLILCEPIQMKENLEISMLICGYAEYYTKNRYEYYVQPIYPPEFNVKLERFIIATSK